MIIRILILLFCASCSSGLVESQKAKLMEYEHQLSMMKYQNRNKNEELRYLRYNIRNLSRLLKEAAHTKKEEEERPNFVTLPKYSTICLVDEGETVCVDMLKQNEE